MSWSPVESTSKAQESKVMRWTKKNRKYLKLNSYKFSRMVLMGNNPGAEYVIYWREGNTKRQKQNELKPETKHQV